MSRAFSSSVQKVPVDVLRPLTKLKELDLSNNKLKIMQDASFYFLKNLKILEMQDNMIETMHKGTFQVSIIMFSRLLIRLFVINLLPLMTVSAETESFSNKTKITYLPPIYLKIYRLRCRKNLTIINIANLIFILGRYTYTTGKDLLVIQQY